MSFCSENDKFSREMTDILQRFAAVTEWVDISNLLEKLKKAFSKFPDSLTPNKKDLAKRLG